MDEGKYKLDQLKQKAAGDKKQNKILIQRLKKMNSRETDRLIHPLHDRFSDEINCLECANCCRSISPAIRNRDVDRMAKFLKVKPSELIEQHLQLDADGDYVFRSRPCPFLGPDNYCSIYDARPKACREYPHTDRNKQQQILAITYRNLAVCPIVDNIFEVLKEEL